MSRSRCCGFFSVPLRLCGKNALDCAFLFAFSAPISRATAAKSQTDDAADIREPNAALSGISRASRVAQMLIQRRSPSLPPVISAVSIQTVQRVNQKRLVLNFH